MTPEKWERFKELFEEATDSADAAREAILRLAEAEGLRDELERLLKEQDRLGSFLSRPVLVDERTKRPPNPMGTSIGRYRLFQKIGEGGMGEVWLAEQTDPVSRRVALKIIKTGMNSREVIARFRSERQALALMDHPTIAKVLDAGSTEQGAPYFVMEYVAGVPITTYCDNHKLNLRERLRLFMLVCEGVQHAHQKAIIHRDLKPSNILVTEIDGKATPKIIDFGVAKALSQKLTSDTLFTRVGAVIGTLEYMSPEQALSAGEDIDTRSDVYSLGVIFYELLSGEPPLRTHKVAFDEFLRRLRNDEAARPSTRIRTVDPRTGTELAAARRTARKALAEELHGELDWIALKALEKDRSRRYSSPTDFASDIARYLTNQTVSAVPPSAFYRVRKFAYRYRTALVTITLFVAVIVLAAAFSIRQTLRASRAAAVSEAINAFLRNDLLGQADPNNQDEGRLDPNLTVRAALDRAARRIDGKFPNQPEVEAGLRETIGQSYTSLQQYGSAVPQFQRASEIYKHVAGDESPTTLRAMTELGYADVFIDPAQAEAILTRTLKVQRRVLGSENPDTISTLSSVAWVEGRLGKRAEATNLFEKVLELRRRILGPENSDTLTTMHDLAGSYLHLGRFAESESLYRQTLQIQLRLFGREDPGALETMDDLSNPIWEQGRKAEAESLLKGALEIEHRVLGDENGTTQDTMETLAEYYMADGQWTLAEPLERRVFGTQTRLQADPNQMLQAQVDLLTTILNSPNRSESRANEALELARKVVKADPDNPYLNAALGLAEYRSGHAQGAMGVLNEAIEKEKDPIPRIYFVLAMAQWRAGKRAEALNSFSKGVEGMKAASSLHSSDKVIWTESATLLGKPLPR
jgi:serine/threonine protein kinase/tetratricopeptide (TPR) repeat protein